MDRTRRWTMTCSGVLLVALAVGSSFAPSTAGVSHRATTAAVKRPRALQVPAVTMIDPKIDNTGRSAAPAPRKAAKAKDPREVFRGLGAWVDLYDYGLNPKAVVATLARSGVRTLYLQTARSNTAYRVHPRAGRWIVAAHAKGIEVVGWYLPYYRNVMRDYQRTMAIKSYRYHGQAFDGIGVDIEFRPQGFSRSRWNRNVARVAAMVDASAGAFPVASIPPPPLQMRIAAGHWRGFPWAAIGKHSDSIMLMSYWSDRRGCPAVKIHCAYGYTASNVRLTRALVGKRPAIHIIGGIGDAMSDKDLRAFIRGARDAGADGASIYDVATMKRAWWRALSVLRSLGS